MSKDLMANLDGKILCPQGAGKPFVCRSFVKEQSKLKAAASGARPVANNEALWL
jgi:hypothetical protein